MSKIVLGCDSNGNDKKCQDTVASILEKAGHDVEKLSIGPNSFAKYSYGEGGKNPKGKIGIYLMAGSLYSVADLHGGNTGFKYAYFGIRGDASPRFRTKKDFETKIVNKDSDCKAICDKYAGNTYPKLNEKTKDKCICVFGATHKELGNALVKAMGGATDTNSSSDSQGSSIKEALTDVLYQWDGEVECYLRDDTVYIHKIPSPSNTKLALVEGDNIDYGSVTVTDYNPSTINYLSCNFKDYDLSIQDDYLIKRFGKIPSTVTPEDGEDFTKLDDAKKFLQREWNKLHRNNGHSLELKTYGDSKWKQGSWCRVYLPSFNIDDYMYITKVSQDDSGDWSCNLTLVDYPPGFGEPTSTNNDSTEEEEVSS